jgi:hypothetical protein
LSGARASYQSANFADENAVCGRLEIVRGAVVPNMTKVVLRVATVLLSHQIDDVESVDSPNNRQHEFLGPALLLHF